MAKNKIKKIIACVMASLFLVMSSHAFSISQSSHVYADGEEYRAYLRELGFPESYLDGLCELHALYPSWEFRPVDTMTTWEEALDGEMGYRINLTANTVNYPTSYHAKDLVDGNVTFDYDANAFRIVSASSWVQASREAVAYYLDPRNFLNDQEIFQFEALTYDGEIQDKRGVERILAGSFMEDAFLDQPSLKIMKQTISGIEEGTRTGELLKNLSCSLEYTITVLNSDGNEKNLDEVIGSGDQVRVSSSDESSSSHLYTCLIYGDVSGDGSIDFTDYLYMKRHIYQFSTLEDAALAAGDVNQDGNVDFTDYLYVKRHIYGYSQISQKRNLSGDEEFSDGVLSDAKALTYSDAIMKIAKELNISPYHLASRLRQEQGNDGNSSQISGMVEGFEGYYNYFNFNANGQSREDIIRNGMTYAKEQGWNSRYASIYGGAQKIAEKYIQVGQNTLYLQKFNVVDDGLTNLYHHQYMQNLLGARSESVRLANTYAQFGYMDNAFCFLIPVFRDMPDQIALCPTQDGNPNPYLASLEVENYVISPNFSKEVLEYFLTVEYNVESVSVSAQAIANIISNSSSCGKGEPQARVVGVGEITLSVGENILPIEVTAGDGTKLTYILHIFREEEQTSETETDASTEAESQASTKE